jgi:hypothetical protein
MLPQWANEPFDPASKSEGIKAQAGLQKQFIVL